MNILCLWLLCATIACATSSLHSHFTLDCWWAGCVAAIITFGIPTFVVFVVPGLLWT